MPRPRVFNNHRCVKEEITEEQVQKNLFALVTSTKYNMVQENGQRKYGGPCPGWDKPNPPSSDCEVFVSHIPDTCFEDVLVPIFSSVGKIYELRLMLDFDGSHRGFAYVKFTEPEHASEAIRKLDLFKLPMGILRVNASRNSCEIEVSNLPMGCSSLVEQLVTKETNALTSVRHIGSTKMLIEYETHRGAAIARRFLLGTLPEVCGCDVRVQLVRRQSSIHQM